MSKIVEKPINLIKLQNKMLQEEQLDIEPIHTFADGMYIRELHIPKGVLIMGKRHRRKTMNMLVKGKMLIYDEHKSFEVETGFMAESEPFTKKAGLALEDSIWINIHPTNETDLDKIEQEFIIPEEEYLAIERGEQ